METSRFFTSSNYNNPKNHLVLLVLLLAFVQSFPLPNQDPNKKDGDTDGFQYIPPAYTCSPSLSNCQSGTHQCLANPNHSQATTDDTCLPCQSSDQTYWPCDVDGLCYCWDVTSPKIPPAPSTRLYNGGQGLNVSTINPCDIITPDVFHLLAPEAAPPYSYEGFCTAVQTYNANHPTEGIFNMGSEEQQKSELAAFFGNALHESDEFKAGREYLMCADTVTVGGEVYCRPCDSGSFDWETMKCPDGASLASGNRTFNSYCQSNLLPPEGCECDNVYERASSGPMAGYVKADEVYFGRGSIQLSWNYNYIRASVAITGAPETFCQRPDLVATNEEYAWGAGLFYWMENVKNDRTCHQSILLNDDFGQTLDNINGGLECPADDAGWHATAVQKRLNRYCRSASAIGLAQLSSLKGCMDMNKRMAQCLEEGTCHDCKVWESTLNIEDDAEAGDESTSGGGREGGGRAKAGKQAKVETGSNESDAATNETSSASVNGKSKKEQDNTTMQHHEATSSSTTSSSSSGELDASSTSNISDMGTSVKEAPTISPSGNKPPTGLQIGVFPTGASSVKPAREPSNSNVSGHHAIRTRRPTPSPSSSETEDLSSTDASQFGVIPIVPSPTSSNVVLGGQPAAQPPSSPSLASQFAATTTVTHSKQNGDDHNDVAHESDQGILPNKVTNFLPEPSVPIENVDEIPPSSNSLALGGMTNWANTKLETTSAVITPSAAPTKNPSEVIDIADAFHMDGSNEDKISVVDEIDGPKQLSAPNVDNEKVSPKMEEDDELGKSDSLVSADNTSISGRIWHEKNSNGFEDVNEPGLRGIVVDLYRCGDDEWLEGTRSSAGGEYIFSNLQEDEYYYVVVTASPGYEFTIKDAGSDVDSNNSDVNPKTGRGDCIQPSSSSAVVNAGISKVTEPTNPVGIISNNEDGSVILEVDYNCRGEPCAEGLGFCRSKHNFCGTSEEYCNDESQWTSECGTPSPTQQPSLTPTTAQPTFKHDPIRNCSGERCEEGDGNWCRSLVGYCGLGPLYCSPESIWVPACDVAKNNTDSFTSDNPTTVDNKQTTFPSLSPSEGPLGVRFSPFALPTLSQIVNPNERAGVRVEINKRVSSETRDEDEKSSASGKELDTLDSTISAEPWYDSFSHVAPKSSAGFRTTTSDRVKFWFAIIILHFFR